MEEFPEEFEYKGPVCKKFMYVNRRARMPLNQHGRSH